MNNNFYDMQRNTELNSIDRGIRKVNQSIQDQTFLEAYIEMIEKRRFRKQLIWSSVSAFIVGFTLIGLFINGWSMTAFINQLSNIVMGWIL